MRDFSEFFLIQVQENMMVITSHGYWDGRVAMAFVQAVQKAAARFQGRAWAVLHDARDLALGTPEVEPIVSGLLASVLTGTLTHHAMVLGTSEVKAWQLNRIFGQASLPYAHRIFQDLAQAEAWLAGQGYARTPG